MSRARSSSLSRTNTALRSSSAIAVIRSFAALNSASSRSIATSLSAAKHLTPPRPLYTLLSPSRNGVRLSLLGCGLLGSAYTPVGYSVQPVRRKAWAGVVLDVSGLQQLID